MFSELSLYYGYPHVLTYPNLRDALRSSLGPRTRVCGCKSRMQSRPRLTSSLHRSRQCNTPSHGSEDGCRIQRWPWTFGAVGLHLPSAERTALFITSGLCSKWELQVKGKHSCDLGHPKLQPIFSEWFTSVISYPTIHLPQAPPLWSFPVISFFYLQSCTISAVQVSSCFMGTKDGRERK